MNGPDCLRHVLVTGAGTGIGRAIALRLGADGTRLSLLARDLGRLEATAEELSGDVHCAACDIQDRSAVEAAVAEAAQRLGPLTAVVANSGVGGPNEASPEDRFDEIVATNLNGTYHTLRAVERHLAPASEARHMVVMSSILARIGVPGYSAYCASKAALLGLVRALACELAPQNVQVNAVCPGWVDTQMARDGLEGMAAGLGVSAEEAYRIAMSEVPLRRMSQPEDVAGLVAWLLSPDARGVTGQAVDMNGGAFMS